MPNSSLSSHPITWNADGNPDNPGASVLPATILSFDVEEHFRIEAAARLHVEPALKARHGERLGPSVQRLLDLLGHHGQRATFFILGEVARDQPAIVRDIQEAGHEVASHGWDHRRVLEMTPAEFREDLRQSKDALEQVAGAPVLGYRAPTFSITRRNPWALDVLAEEGFLYDSSIYSVRHDRYGVPGAPRTPFLARGHEHAILELPPATLRLGGLNVPVGGGGYFRLLPLALMERALEQVRRHGQPAVAMLYFHPWEFEPDQPRLPLGRLNHFRTYVGIARSQARLAALLERRSFTRALDVVEHLVRGPQPPPGFLVADRRG